METLQSLLSQAKQKISSLDAEIIFCEVLSISPVEIFTQSEKILTIQEQEKILELVEMRKSGKSISEVFQKKGFFGEEFFVTNDVLTPRPETEFLVEYALSELENFSNQNQKKISGVIDIGTGSGCIIISIAKKFFKNSQTDEKNINFYASDISEKALEVAQKNAKNIFPLEKEIEFKKSNLLENFLANEIENALIVTNLPYIPQKDENWMDREVLFGDPHLALFSGEEGIDLYEKFFLELSQKQKNFYAVVFEFDPPQENFFQHFLLKIFPEKKITFFTDLRGEVRFGVLS